ncbi:hypothetical protein PV05_10032 [Exophiala xenobiotica]|uniref:DUF1868 domain-containing protein n=1 Tax=Exophiala xenobiotica TaxID=348802 RepID=A0A0D2E9E7_9EURO|nr:uncharacterized protein PV05_10032 [Exophiala xenobiotica]KIW51295.1 hypothetical protein PV05_10032 [Exophiala xenobiotica]
MAQVVTDIPYRADESHPDQESRVAPIPRPGYHGRYPRWIGHKFEPDGSVRSFPGHGIMCHLPPHDAMYHALQQFRDDLQQQDFASSLVLLPPSVWHMTVYEGVSDQIRKRNGRPGELDLDCSLEQCHKFVTSKLASFDLGCEPWFRMRPVGWEPIEDGIALKIAGANAVEEEKIRGLRDRLANLHTVEQHDKEDLARYLQMALEKLPKEFELGAPGFCTYENMVAINRKFDLINQADGV